MIFSALDDQMDDLLIRRSCAVSEDIEKRCILWEVLTKVLSVPMAMGDGRMLEKDVTGNRQFSASALRIGYTDRHIIQFHGLFNCRGVFPSNWIFGESESCSKYDGVKRR